MGNKRQCGFESRTAFYFRPANVLQGRPFVFVILPAAGEECRRLGAELRREFSAPAE